PRAPSARNRAPFAPVRAGRSLPSVRIVPWLRSQHASRGLRASRRWLRLVVRRPGSGIPVSLGRLSGPLPRTEVLFLAVRGLSLRLGRVHLRGRELQSFLHRVELGPLVREFLSSLRELALISLQRSALADESFLRIGQGTASLLEFLLARREAGFAGLDRSLR